MKYLYIGIVFLWSLVSCEDVIEVDTPSEPPRLFVDAVLRIDTEEAETTARVQVGLTNSFFEAVQPTDLESISIQNPDYTGPEGPVLILNETAIGDYQATVNTDFFTGGTLTLSIVFQGEEYRATTEYVPSVPIDGLEEGDGILFSGEETEVIISFTDAPNRVDFYLFDLGFNEYLVSEDTFYPGQPFQFSYFYEDGLESGRELTISIIGVSEPFYRYLDQVIEQANQGEQGPFQTPAATVRGNIVNMTNEDQFALGYFAVCQTYSDSLILE